jgi:hypothetical protein
VSPEQLHGWHSRQSVIWLQHRWEAEGCLDISQHV